MSGLYILFLLVALWLLFNLLSPWALLLNAQRMSTGRIPPEIASVAYQLGVQFYTSDLRAKGGLSVLAWPRRLVVFDRESFARTPSWALRFLIAHELGHCACGHLAKRWWLTVTGLCLLPASRRWLAGMEREADAFAERLTGLAASSFYRRDHPTQ